MQGRTAEKRCRCYAEEGQTLRLDSGGQVSVLVLIKNHTTKYAELGVQMNSCRHFGIRWWWLVTSGLNNLLPSECYHENRDRIVNKQPWVKVLTHVINGPVLYIHHHLCRKTV